MSLDEGVSRFIGSLYEAVYDADAWHSALIELMARTGSRMAFVSCVDLKNLQYARTNFIHPDDTKSAVGAGEYMNGMAALDPSLSWAAANPMAGLCDTATLMPREEFRQLEYVKWQESRMGTVHWRVFYTSPVDDLTFALSLHPPASAGPASKQTARLHKLLFEHVSRALRLATRPPDLGHDAESVIILDSSGKVLTMSPRAERLICEGDGLNVHSRTLSALTPDATARIESAIRSAVTSSAFGGSGGGVRLPRGNGRPDWLALVSPSPRFLEHLPIAVPAAVLRIIDAHPQHVLTAHHAELFDLSPREMQVGEALLGGHSLESMCALLGITRNTGKVHLQSLFRKTGTNRQSELVHLLAELARG